MSLKSVVTFVKELQPGQSVSYGRTFTADRPMRVATVCVGYADGYPRMLSGGPDRGVMVIRGQRAPVVGRVCMDQTMVDVTDDSRREDGRRGHGLWPGRRRHG